MKQVVATLIAVAFGAAALHYGRSDVPPKTTDAPRGGEGGAAPAFSDVSAPSGPDRAGRQAAGDVVWALLEAAQAGDAARYVAHLARPLRARFEGSSQDGEAAAGLRQSLFGVKGIAVMAADPTGNETCVVNVEFQYGDRKEGQRFHLRHRDASWQIERIETARPLEQIIPYGTPVDQVPR